MRAFGAPSRQLPEKCREAAPRQIGEHRRGAIGVQAALLAAVAAFSVPFDRDVPELAAALVLPLVELPPEQDRAAHRVAQREVERVGPGSARPRPPRSRPRWRRCRRRRGGGSTWRAPRSAGSASAAPGNRASGRRRPKRSPAWRRPRPAPVRRAPRPSRSGPAPCRPSASAYSPAHRKGAFLPAFGEDARPPGRPARR